jgi:hypothetical protein
MEVSSVDLTRLAAMIPDGVSPGTDVSTLTVGTVTGLKISAGQVQVRVAGSEPVWLPAAPFIYESGATVRLRRSALNGGRLEFCEGPLTPAPTVVTGKVTAITDETLTVDVLGGTFDLGYTSSTYDVGEVVAVLRHPSGFGVPQWVLGIAGKEQQASNPGGGSGNPGQSQARQATISPQDSGSYKVSGGRWDSWNTNRYGGVRALWQGNQYGSGPMVGWAGYGDQIVNLWASQITGMWVDVQRSDSSVNDPKAVLLQGSPDGTRPGGAPGGTGDGAGSPGLAPNQQAQILLPSSTYEAWRTGGIKGLRTAGADYLALFGADRGGAMSLTIQYTVVA